MECCRAAFTLEMPWFDIARSMRSAGVPPPYPGRTCTLQLATSRLVASCAYPFQRHVSLQCIRVHSQLTLSPPGNSASGRSIHGKSRLTKTGPSGGGDACLHRHGSRNALALPESHPDSTPVTLNGFGDANDRLQMIDWRQCAKRRYWEYSRIC